PHDNQTEPQGTADPTDARHFVIVGGGAAGSAAAEELRRAGFTGRITIVSAAPNAPVDRPNLSKDYLDGHAKPEWIPLRGTDWYAGHDVELVLDTAITRLDVDEHLLYATRQAPLHYDKLLVATGAIPRRLEGIPGADLNGILTLRTLDDADRIIQAATAGQRAVVVGASFIGMEVAASLAGGREVNVTVVAPEEVPFSRVLGDDVGRMFQQLHEQHGVRFCLSDGVVGLRGQDGRVQQVDLKSGESLDADLVVVGVGVVPATDFLRDSGLSLNEHDHSVQVDRQLRTSHPDIYAAGDIARWDDGSDKGVRIEHWRVAQQQGIVAAHNMLGENQSIKPHVPFFWTTQWKLRLNYVGHASAWDDILYWGGRPEQRKFIAFYVKDGRLHAAAGCGYDAELDAVEFILRDQLPLSVDQMRDPGFDFIAFARDNAEPTLP
ncbi:MAG: NAD(FAD)-dependent dehydrogenase, partial [Chloroflexi bacterium]